MNNHTKQRIGIVGGMGNEAMLDLIEKMAQISTSKSCEFIAFGNAKLAYKPSELLQTWLATDLPELRKKDTAMFTLKFMQSLGVDVLGLACNSGHDLFRKLMTDRPFTFVDMIHQSAHYLEGTKKQVLVMGVDSLVHSGLYQDALTAQGVSSTVPSALNQTKVMAAIYDNHFGIKTGHISHKAEHLLCDVIREECHLQHCSKILLGCTELPLALTSKACAGFKKEGLIPENIEIIDASQILAESLLGAIGKREYLSTTPDQSAAGPNTDWFAPLCFKVDSLEDMARIQKKVFCYSVDFLKERNLTISGSYMHLPTLFISDTATDAENTLIEMGIPVHIENNEIKATIIAALSFYYDQLKI